MFKVHDGGPVDPCGLLLVFLLKVSQLAVGTLSFHSIERPFFAQEMGHQEVAQIDSCMKTLMFAEHMVHTDIQICCFLKCLYSLQ